jgi:hypothetical protein
MEVGGKKRSMQKIGVSLKYKVYIRKEIHSSRLDPFQSSSRQLSTSLGSPPTDEMGREQSKIEENPTMTLFCARRRSGSGRT